MIFQYLTGFGEPESVAVLVPGREQAQYVLFVATATRCARPGTDGAPVPKGPRAATVPMMPSPSPTSMKSFLD